MNETTKLQRHVSHYLALLLVGTLPTGTTSYRYETNFNSLRGENSMDTERDANVVH